jgi:antitoxin CptB
MVAATGAPTDPSPGRLRWRCRRGMKELDVLLGRFFDARYRDLDAAGRAAFERLLDADDPSLYRWLTGRERAPDPAVRALLARMPEPGTGRDGA